MKLHETPWRLQGSAVSIFVLYNAGQVSERIINNINFVVEGSVEFDIIRYRDFIFVVFKLFNQKLKYSNKGDV